MMIFKQEIMQRDFPAQHPVIKEYKGPDILMFAAKLTGNRYKTTVVMSCGKTGSGDPYAMLDRSPCGSGTAALMALLWEEQKIQGIMSKNSTKCQYRSAAFRW